MKAGLVCVGLTTLDVAARPIEAIPREETTTLIEGVACSPAGTAGGAALVAARLGLGVRLVSAVGDDATGRFVRFLLEEEGVDTSLLDTITGRTTSATVLAIDSAGRRPNFHAPGVGTLARADESVIAASQGAKFLHYAGIGGRRLDGGAGAALVQAARAAGTVVTCDLISPRPTAMEELARLLPSVDYFLPSAAEALGLTGLGSLEAAADLFLSMGAGACVIKNGRKGAYAALGETRATLPAHAINPVDTTSCGDGFCAGFIAALDRGWAPLEACRFAMATAALVAMGMGTLGRVASFEATEAAMREMTLDEAA
jgi:sugar/nucleoside kinase (ribokinase family)